MTNLANQVTRGDEDNLANMINETFQSVSAGLQKPVSTHHHSAAVLHDKYQVPIEFDVKKAAGPHGIPHWVL